MHGDTFSPTSLENRDDFFTLLQVDSDREVEKWCTKKWDLVSCDSRPGLALRCAVFNNGVVYF